MISPFCDIRIIAKCARFYTELPHNLAANVKKADFYKKAFNNRNKVVLLSQK